MIDWWNRRRLNAAKEKLAGYEARDKFLQDEFFVPQAQTVPAYFVLEMMQLHQNIAELQERIRQLETSP